MIKQKHLKKVAINKSRHFALAKESKTRLVSSEKLAIAWLETRSNMEMQVYPDLIALGHQVIAEAFSN